MLATLTSVLCAAASAPASAAPSIRHVFVIVLENEGYNSTFGTPPGLAVSGQDASPPMARC